MTNPYNQSWLFDFLDQQDEYRTELLRSSMDHIVGFGKDNPSIMEAINQLQAQLHTSPTAADIALKAMEPYGSMSTAVLQAGALDIPNKSELLAQMTSSLPGSVGAATIDWNALYSRYTSPGVAEMFQDMVSRSSKAVIAATAVTDYLDATADVEAKEDTDYTTQQFERVRASVQDLVESEPELVEEISEQVEPIIAESVDVSPKKWAGLSKKEKGEIALKSMEYLPQMSFVNALDDGSMLAGFQMGHLVLMFSIGLAWIVVVSRMGEDE